MCEVCGNDNCIWPYDEETKEKVQKGVEQAIKGEFVEGPNIHEETENTNDQ